MKYCFEMKQFVSEETYVKATSAATPLELDNISSSLIAKCVSTNFLEYVGFPNRQHKIYYFFYFQSFIRINRVLLLHKLNLKSMLLFFITFQNT
jgi:hypothetical protein